MLSLETILRVVAPHDCIGCGQESTLFCVPCSYGLDVVPSRCYRCLAITRDAAVCRRCRPHSSLKHVWVSTEYEGLAKELLRLYKFERAKAAYKVIAEHLADTLPFLETGTLISYVPTATSRQRLRGYDQSLLIAKELARIKQVKFVSLLERHGQTRQVGATKTQRFQQASEMFRLKYKSLPSHTQLIIIDDIVTTGASLEAAAALLKAAGAKQVNAAVFAQKH